MSGGGQLSDSWHILLAEDNEDHALLIRMALERATPRPVELAWVRDGDSAVEAVEREPPDLLLLDLNMPGRSGYEVLERLKSDVRLRGVPVAVLTSSDRDEDVARSYGLGSNHFITKPENPADLERRLRTLLDQLHELTGVRRGRGEIAATAVSDLRRSLIGRRREVVVAVLFVIAVVLLAYFVFAGR